MPLSTKHQESNSFNHSRNCSSAQPLVGDWLASRLTPDLTYIVCKLLVACLASLLVGACESHSREQSHSQPSKPTNTYLFRLPSSIPPEILSSNRLETLPGIRLALQAETSKILTASDAENNHSNPRGVSKCFTKGPATSRMEASSAFRSARRFYLHRGQFQWMFVADI